MMRERDGLQNMQLYCTDATAAEVNLKLFRV